MRKNIDLPIPLYKEKETASSNYQLFPTTSLSSYQQDQDVSFWANVIPAADAIFSCSNQHQDPSCSNNQQDLSCSKQQDLSSRPAASVFVC